MQEKCGICYENNIDNQIVCRFKPCNHWICLPCYKKYDNKSNRCCFCRKNIKDIDYDGDFMIYIDSNKENYSVFHVNILGTTPDDLVYIILHKLYDNGFKSEYIRLLYKGECLTDYRYLPLYSFNIRPCDIINVVFRLRGD
jgi:hypothetical protein